MNFMPFSGIINLAHYIIPAFGMGAWIGPQAFDAILFIQKQGKRVRENTGGVPRRF